jgi:hypothetical protein
MSFYSQTAYTKAESSFYSPLYGNYKFDTNLTDFGLMLERRVRKVNRKGSVLKLQTNSIYPMLDEFGYTFMDFFIFRSTWDQGYHFETVIPEVKTFKDTRSARFKEIDNVDRVIKTFEKENFSIGRSYIQTRNQNNLDR